MAKTALGERLKYLRSKTGKTQEEVAKELGTTRAAYSHLENNRNEPDTEMLSKLADLYKVTADYLLGRKIDLGTVPVAAHIDGDMDELTDEERQEIQDYIEFKKAQYKKRHENDK